jgi:hypothetical protein
MDATWFQIAQGVAAIVTVLMAVAIGPLFKLLHKIKTNDLHHLDAKIDVHHKAVTVQIETVGKQVGSLASKFDEHIQWHLNREN